MTRNLRWLAVFAGLLSFTSAYWTANAQSAHDVAGQQRGPEQPNAKASLATALTPERIAAEADTPLDVVHLEDPLRWSPDGARVAWMKLLRPAAKAADPTQQQEVWTYDPKSIDASKTQVKPILLIAADKVTAALSGSNEPHHATLDDDDSSANPFLLKEIAWSPDHSHLLLAGATSLAWFDVAAGTSQLLTKGDDPIADAAIAPNGQTVSFVREHRLCLIGVGGGDVRIVAGLGRNDLLQGELDWPYRNSLHLERGYFWSPDSTRIAYLQIDDREVAKYALRTSDGEAREIAFPKAGGAMPIVSVYVKQVSGPGSTAAAREIDLGKTKGLYIPLLRWLPDGHRLAIERIDRLQHTLELLLADAGTGKAQVILTENDRYWINLAGDLTFLQDGKRFLWSSERTGYRHLYLYGIDGKQIAQLTKGDWEITRLHAVDEAKGLAYFTATEKSPLERHLYQVSLDGSAMTRITQKPGTHMVSIAPHAAGLIDTYSNRSTPPQKEILPLGDATGAAGVQIAEDTLPLPPLQPVEFQPMKMHLGAETEALMVKPPAFDPAKKYPVIVYMAGGPGEQLVRDVWMGSAGLWMQAMAQKGYIVFALDNQGTAGRGHFFEEPIHLRLGGQEMADQRDGILYLATLPYVDMTRIGACGWGYGGFLAVHAILDRPVPYKAAFAGAPILDWHFYDAFFAERYLDDTVVHADGWDASKATENNSPNFFSGSLMVAQGTLDENVHMENLLTLQDKLLDAGKSADVLLFSDRGHRIDDPPSRNLLFKRMTDFFVKNL